MQPKSKYALRMTAVTTVLCSSPHVVHATDIVNGWSPPTLISKIHSTGSHTLFRLDGTTQSCGHPDYWTLAVDDTARSGTKHALLLAAYTAGKTVALRCENSQVTDFEISG